MPRYFVNIHDDQSVFDEVGIELSDRREMRIHMVTSATAYVENRGATKGDWEMEVIDEKGQIVAVMDFSVETRKFYRSEG